LFGGFDALWTVVLVLPLGFTRLIFLTSKKVLDTVRPLAKLSQAHLPALMDLEPLLRCYLFPSKSAALRVCPVSVVLPSAIVLIVLLIVVSVACSIAALSAGESSCAPTLADSGGFLPLEVFTAINGLIQITV
jgi:hypothetical protein